MNRPVPYEALMMLSLSQLSDAFPHGAKEVKGRWVRARAGEADRPLKQLLKDRKAREEKPRLLAATSVHRMRWSKREKRWVTVGGTDDEDIGYTDNPSRAMRPDVGNAVDKATQERFSEEARARFQANGPSLAERVAELERDGRISAAQWNSLRRRVAGLERSTHEKAA